MKIAFVVHDYRRREGHSRYVVELATRFAREHEVHVFATEIEPDGNTKIHFHHVPAWRPNTLTGILTFVLMATLRVRGEFDIIHNQGLCGVRGNVFTGHICNRAWHRALRAASGRLKFHEWVSGTTLSALEHLFYRTARRCKVIAVSRRLAGDLQRLYHCAAPISTIYHGVDLAAFSPAAGSPIRAQVRRECELNPQEMAFLFVGDMRKGGRQSIRALSKLRTGTLLFVSRSPVGAYRGLAAELGVEARVRFLGMTTQVEKYYAAADALLLPTHYDSFALVVTEAMASGLPVIVSREAGAAELIHSGVDGLVLDDFNDWVELGDKMRLLSEDRMLAQRMGTAARATVERYSWDETAAQTMRVYEELVGTREAAVAVSSCSTPQ
ncbi:MAG TPA: glycosyltransferase family 4 protein [Bryobacteraceae bacterium]|nr:glycosyltransferase family 4 protein [Bryobacteraceae bacterium]